jgi:uncharacterized protein YggU (UPF0235/DUF167 family)
MAKISSACIRVTPAGVALEVVVVTRAKRTRFLGFHGGRPKFALAAIPENGRANEELISAIAELLSIPPGRVELLRGHTSRLKTLLLKGIEPKNVAQVLESTTPS